MTEASETLPTTDVKKRPWNAMDITTWSSVFPLSSVCMVIVLVLVRPDHAREALDTWSKHFKMTPAVFIGTTFLSAVGLMIVCLFSMWAILAIFYGIKEYYANKEGMKKERAALIEFFEALGGNGWKDKTRWCSEEPLGRWKGIKVDHNNGRVNKIILPSNRLEGEIPGHIFRDLPFLREIDLRENSIRGPIPEEFCDLIQLEGLYLYDNYLTGKIPPGLLKLPRLCGIYLFSNSLEDIGEMREAFKKKLLPDGIVYI